MRTSKSIIYTVLLICTGFLFTACEKSELQEQLEPEIIKIEILDENWEKREHTIDYSKSDLLSEDLPQLRSFESGTSITASIESEDYGHVAIAYREGKGGNVVIGSFENPTLEGEIICTKVLDDILMITMEATKGMEAEHTPYCTIAIRDIVPFETHYDIMVKTKGLDNNIERLKTKNNKYDILVLPRNEKDCIDPVFVTPIIKNFISWEAANGEVDILH